VLNPVIAWAGFAGSWLLVAGPIYQAAIELAAEDIERDAMQAAYENAEAPESPSAWWWLLPPVGYVRWLRARRQHRQAALQLFTPLQMEQFVRFGNKATAWTYIAGGAFLVALAETWELREIYRWPIPVYVVVVAIMFALCAANTARRLKQTRELLPEAAASKQPDRYPEPPTASPGR
jgi:hypothetical protein